MSKSYDKRLAKIEEIADRMARKKPTRDCTDWSSKEILQAVDKAIHPADRDLLDRIIGHVNEIRIHRDQKAHHFIDWLRGLKIGSWHLPKRIPREWLEGFDRANGAVLFRCEDCLAGLGNGRKDHYQTCPICGSANLSVKKLSGPPWDAHWEYTPLPRR